MSRPDKPHTLPDKPHLVVLHRWRDHYAEYDRYLDHDRYAVSYVSTEVGVDGVPAGAAEIVPVAATDDLALVAPVVRGLADRHGPPAGVIALKEDDLLTAAHLGQSWRCPGRSPGEVTLFRDKLVMTRAVAAAGLRVPATAAAPDAAAVREHGDRWGWPVIVKPRLGSSSEGVTIIDGPGEAAGLPYGRDRLLVQAKLDEQIHHVDGVFDGRRLTAWRVSRYVDTCLGFREGRPLGSVEQQDPELLAAVERFATAVMQALTDTAAVFHLEVFVGRAPDGGVRCTLLEVGARVGGAEIPFLWREVHGYDLMRAAVQISLGRPPDAPGSAYRPPALAGGEPPETAGMLLVPAPARRPCRITAATSLVGRLPAVYAEAVPGVGDLIPAADAYYEHVGARYRFRGPDSATVTAAVETAARTARVIGEGHDELTAVRVGAAVSEEVL